MSTALSSRLPAALLLVGAAACSGAKATPAPSATGADTADAKEPAAPTPAPAPAPPARRRERIGPTDLAAPTVDLTALFPEDRLAYAKADVPWDEPTSTVYVHRPGYDNGQGDDLILTVELDRDAQHIVRIVILTPAVETSDGVRIGMPVRALAERLPAARCEEDSCRAPGRGFEYVTHGLRHPPLPADAAPDTRIDLIRWKPDGLGPTVVNVPPGSFAPEPVPAHDAPPTVGAAVERCARMYVLMARCGVGLSAASGNFGRTGPFDVSIAEAREACADVTPGIAPAVVLEEEVLARYEASAARSCRAFVRAIDEAYGLDDQFGRGF